MTHFLYVPFTGLGLYGGHRGKRWLRNRIKIFKQFVVPSLMQQTNKNLVLWISWRFEDRNDPLVVGLKNWLEDATDLTSVFTYSGVCFWDDKYSDVEAHERLVNAIHGSMGDLFNVMGESKEILMTIQPSDDVYAKDMVEDVQTFFAEHPDIHVYGYSRGYVMDYVNCRIAEWNPKTTPPFYTIRFPRAVFTDPLKHVKHTGPYKSHEYVKDYLPALYTEKRGFIVGTHGENISTIFNHPYTGHEFLGDNTERILGEFGLSGVEPLHIRTSLRRAFMRKLPHGWQRKLRYWVGEKFYARFYDFLRS